MELPNLLHNHHLQCEYALLALQHYTRSNVCWVIAHTPMLFGVVIGPVTEYLHTRAHTHTHRQNPSQTTSHTRNKTTTTTTVPMVGLLYSPKFQFGPSITYDKSTIYPFTSDHVGQAFHLSRLLTPAEPPRTPIVWDHDGHALETRRTSMGTVWTLEMWSLHPLCKLGKTCR